jgi:hypothetical protein
MGTATWQPKWWTSDKHGSTWERVKDAMKRDWEQTKSDLGSSASADLDQDVDDTVKQATGKDVIPPGKQPNAPGGTKASDARPSSPDWERVETPLRFGWGARQQYGAEHQSWDNGLETTLKSEWEEGKGDGRLDWKDVKRVVRHGYERARS